MHSLSLTELAQVTYNSLADVLGEGMVSDAIYTKWSETRDFTPDVIEKLYVLATIVSILEKAEFTPTRIKTWMTTPESSPSYLSYGQTPLQLIHGERRIPVSNAAREHERVRMQRLHK